MDQRQLVSIKLFLTHKHAIRRARLPTAGLNMGLLDNMLDDTTIRHQFHWIDEDGDQIELCTEADLQEALLAQKGPCIKIYAQPARLASPTNDEHLSSSGDPRIIWGNKEFSLQKLSNTLKTSRVLQEVRQDFCKFQQFVRTELERHPSWKKCFRNLLMVTILGTLIWPTYLHLAVVAGLLSTFPPSTFSVRAPGLYQFLLGIFAVRVTFGLLWGLFNPIILLAIISYTTWKCFSRHLNFAEHISSLVFPETVTDPALAMQADADVDVDARHPSNEACLLPSAILQLKSMFPRKSSVELASCLASHGNRVGPTVDALLAKSS